MKYKHGWWAVTLIVALLLTGCETPQSQVETRDLITANNYSRIVGMQWFLESMTIDSQRYPLAGERPYIQFAQDAKVTGFATINRFFGGVQFGPKGELSWPGPFGMTRMAGTDAMMKQEDTFVKTLPKTEQMSVAGNRLHIYTKDRAIELVFYVPVQ